MYDKKYKFVILILVFVFINIEPEDSGGTTAPDLPYLPENARLHNSYSD